VSYSIHIGNAEPVGDIDEAYAETAEWGGEIRFPWNGVHVPQVNLPDAPTFVGDEMTGNGNGRHPGYSQWSDFCEAAGLHGLFFEKHVGLMSSHPGTFALRAEHHAIVRAALTNWQNNHPNATPGFGDENDGVLARLLWLDFWMGWALGNCARPAVHNS
jgi:hypothetical protein